MPRLTDLVQVIITEPDGDLDAEDIFADAQGIIFPDESRNLHGDSNSTITYKSRRFGDLKLRTSNPELEHDRKLFSHYLWNAGLKLSELISTAESEDRWSVVDHTVLELGAGVGLAGIVATLAGAQRTVISDYPAEVVLRNIESNAKRNIPSALTKHYLVQGHEWGSFDNSFAVSHKASFTKILAADCFWMAHEHDHLVESMSHFLSEEESSRVYVVAGFHTGRATLVAFFAAAQRNKFDIDEIYEEDIEGSRRPWAEVRNGGLEDPTERKRWLVIARLKRGRTQ